MNSTDSADITSLQNECWTFECKVDHMFNNLMDNGYIKGSRYHKYIQQATTNFPNLRINPYCTFFDIYKKDLADDTKYHLEIYIQDCKNEKEDNRKLNGLFVEVIALIYKEAEPQILSGIQYEYIQWVKKAINEIRTRVSKKWRLV